MKDKTCNDRCGLPDNLSKLDVPLDEMPNLERVSIYLTEMSEESIRINIWVQILYEEINAIKVRSEASVF